MIFFAYQFWWGRELQLNETQLREELGREKNARFGLRNLHRNRGLNLQFLLHVFLLTPRSPTVLGRKSSNLPPHRHRHPPEL